MSVLLPTTRWTDACAAVAAQLGDGDELLVIHDGEDAPVTDVDDHPDGVRLVAAGEPEGCSGKANAIAAGMEAARRDRLVFTDDALLMEHLEVTTVRRRHLVPVGGTVRGTVERVVRWTKIIWQHDPGAIAGVGLVLVPRSPARCCFPSTRQWS